MRRIVLALAVAFMVSGAGAQEVDYLATEGKLTAEDFYRLVACRALPGQACSVEIVRWAPPVARRLAVAVAPVPAAYPADMAQAASRALDRAIAEINGAGAAINLVRVGKGEAAPITIHLSPVYEGQVIQGTGVDGVDGQTIGAALVTVWWDEAFALTSAVIVLACDLPVTDLEPVILEELTQATGLMTDIRNPAYETLSVFSEDSNTVTRLSPLDRDVLRRHYPLDP